MTPAHHDDTIVRGDGFKMGFRLAHLNPSTQQPVYDYNFTGWTGKCQMRLSSESPDVMLELTVAVADQGLTPGLVWVTATGAETATLTEEGGVYDVQLTPPAGEPWTIAEGRLDVHRDVSRP